jgi:hypothetical protein
MLSKIAPKFSEHHVSWIRCTIASGVASATETWDVIRQPIASKPSIVRCPSSSMDMFAEVLGLLGTQKGMAVAPE